MEQSGILAVRVFATAAQLPLEGATVVVTTRAENGKFDLVSLQKTDRSGTVRPVTVLTPAAGESTAQPGDGLPPYAVVDVWAEHPGFAVMRVDGVQIFPGVTTRQEMELLPLGEGQHGLDRIDEREITAQNL